MTKVQERLSVASDTKSITNEVYRVAFWAVVALAAVVGIVSFAALGVGIAKSVMLISAAIG